jgi:diphthine-ammonia ligase
MSQVFVSWSGGKDGCLALYRAKQAGHNIRYLFNMVSEDKKRSRSHGVRAAVIKEQARALGIPIIQQPTVDEEYEAVFIKKLKDLKRRGVEMGVFGDIDFEPHREWVEKVCNTAGMTAQLPLWQENQSKLLEEFINAGFKAIVITVKADLMGKEFLGRILDKKLIADIAGLDKNITPCGEAGEFHTLVVDGPIFKKRLDLIKTEIVSRGEHHFLEILKTELKPKKGGT